MLQMLPEDERPIRQVIGENVEKYFKSSEYQSLTNFAKDVGLDSVRIKKVMSGEYGVTADKLQLIAGVLGIKTTDLIDDWS